LGFDCQQCRNDPELKETWGCEKPKQVAVWQDDEDNEFYNCPLRFVPQTVYDWFYEYEYYQLFQGSAPAFEKQAAKFYDAARVYKMTLLKYAPKPRQDKGDGLQILRESYNARSRN
jgi:hypothetical protein